MTALTMATAMDRPPTVLRPSRRKNDRVLMMSVKKKTVNMPLVRIGECSEWRYSNATIRNRAKAAMADKAVDAWYAGPLPPGAKLQTMAFATSKHVRSAVAAYSKKLAESLSRREELVDPTVKAQK